jgi:hypothetical protein
LQFSFLGFRRIAKRDSIVALEGTMRPKKHNPTGSGDLFRARLDQIINMKHALVTLAGKIDWDWIDQEVAPLYSGEAAGTELMQVKVSTRLAYPLSDSLRSLELRCRLSG